MSEYICIRKIDTNECPNIYSWPIYSNNRIFKYIFHTLVLTDSFSLTFPANFTGPVDRSMWGVPLLSVFLWSQVLKYCNKSLIHPYGWYITKYISIYRGVFPGTSLGIAKRWENCRTLPLVTMYWVIHPLRPHYFLWPIGCQGCTTQYIDPLCTVRIQYGISGPILSGKTSWELHLSLIHISEPTRPY